MCGFGGGSPTPPVPPPVVPPSKSDAEVQEARTNEARRRRLAQGGQQGTILTTALGAAGTAPTKTKLGA